MTHKAQMVLGTLTRSQFEVKVFDHAPETVASVGGGTLESTARPVFYLSGSPWNLHQRIAGAFAQAKLPVGSMILRSYSREPLDAYQYKHPHLEELFKAFPHRKWVLFGDSGEKDPEVYADLRKAHPEQVAHIYIHNATNAKPTEARFKDMTTFINWADVAKDPSFGAYVWKQ